MPVNFKKAIYTFISLAIVLATWQLGAIVVNNSFILPGVDETLVALMKILGEDSFAGTILLTLLRVLLGLLLGIIIGVVVGFLSHRFEFLNYLFSFITTIVKSTPIASIIILLWLMLDGNSLAIFVTILMIFPVISENVVAGLNSIDPALMEVCEVYNIVGYKRLKLLTFPSVFRYIIPAMITSVGLAWKAEVAAEIIGYVSKSIGSFINDSKSNFDTDRVFAWTLLVILLSLFLEHITKFILRRLQRDV